MLEITMATLRKMHTAGSRLRRRYPCESSDDLWSCRLIEEMREGPSQWLKAVGTLLIKNISYVN